ncbi:MAG: hypothetical protein ACRDGE_02915 [Candidatus Limnocylindria bacterium]
MRKQASLLIGMALSALVMIGLTTSADRTSANFEGTTAVTGAFTTEEVVISNDAPGGVLVSIGDLVPGDIVTRTVTITNGGDPFTYTVSASTGAGGVLWTDTTNGLQVQILDAAATELYNGPVKDMTFAARTLAGAGSEVLTFKFTLPAGAGGANSPVFMNQTQDFTVTFTATGRDGDPNR